MIPDFFQSQDSFTHIGIWRTIIGLLIVLFATFIGVEVRLGKDDEDN